MDSLVPRIVGDPRFERYVIRNRSSNRFWSGKGWTRRVGRARLYADFKQVQRTMTSIYSSWLRGGP